MQIAPLPQGFGAEITGFSLQDDRSEADVARLREAFDAHHLLIFRGEGTITPDRQTEICGWFGPTGCDTGQDGRSHTMMDNAEAIGRKALPFHSDITYMEFPIEGISLHPLDLPRSPTSTTFVSNACGWDALSPELQDELHDALGQHYYADSLTMDMDWPIFEYWHPVRMEHPRTGRPLLFVTEHHVEQLSGVSDERSAQLLPILFDILYAPERRYEHFWQSGDLLVWDNLAIQHARTREADPSEGKRLLQRVQIGAHGFLEQLEKVRRQAAEVTS
ncbi:MAG: TauD/TfdA family dioxygenase [Novosphingobium sp.]